MSNNFPPDGKANKTNNLYACADRVSPGDEPKDITAVKGLYLPFDARNKATHLQKNPFGVVIYRTQVNAGNIYQAFDGKRLVVEVGCDTIVYIHINLAQPQKHHRLFIQSEKAFSGDTTIRRDAAEIAKNTRHVETMVKFEMYFILGVMSTAGLGAWLAITGSDVTCLYASKKYIADAAKKLSTTLLKELDEVGKYAPTLHEKIWELILSEGKNNATEGAKRLPSIIVRDEKVQAQVAGVIFGKWAMPSGGGFTVWQFFTVLLMQAASKSVTKYADAYLQAVDNRYKPMIEMMKQVDPHRPGTLQKPAEGMVKLLQESGVKVTPAEAKTIITEVVRNRERASKNLTNIVKAIDEFRKVANK